MKKLVLFISFIAFSIVTLNAQIEIRRSDMSYPGATYLMSVDTSVQLNQSNFLSGDSFTWDLTQLDINDNRVVKFLAPDANNGGVDHPSCNLVIQEDDTDPTYSYIKADGSEMLMLSNSEDSFSAILARHRMMIFPMKYGDGWVDSNHTLMQFTGEEFGIPFLDSVRLDIQVEILNNVDAAGTIKLPAGSADVLRVSTEIVIGFKLEGLNGSLGWSTLQQEQQSQKSWSFYGKEGGYRIATINEKENGQDYEVDYRSQSLVNVRRIQVSSFDLYPNPVSQNSLQIKSPEQLNLMLMDLQGKVIKGNIRIDQFNQSLDVSHLQPGMYRLIGTTESGQTVQQSFIKQ